MKTPTWEPSVGNLLAFLNASTELMMCDLYTFTTVSGTAFYYTSGALPVTVNGYTYATGAKINRNTIRSVVGIEVDSLAIDLYAESSVLMGALPMIQALAQGLMDNGSVQLERLFLNAAGVMQGTLLLFAGRVGQVVTSRGHASLEILSNTELLSVMIPAGVYQPSCRNTLFDLNCGVNRAAYQIMTAAQTATDVTRQRFTANLASTAAAIAGYLNLGSVIFTSGANAGIGRTVKSQTGAGNASTIAVICPWPFPVAAGDTFVCIPGCDKTMATCVAKYANLTRFSGEPFIPLPQTTT